MQTENGPTFLNRAGRGRGPGQQFVVLGEGERSLNRLWSGGGVSTVLVGGSQQFMVPGSKGGLTPWGGMGQIAYGRGKASQQFMI